MSFATIASSTDLVGSYGAGFALENHTLFGFLSYIYPVALIWALFLWFKNPGISFRRIEVILSCVLLFFTLVIFQALIVSNEFRGSLGGNFVDFLSPYIGVAGVWIFWLVTTVLGTIVLLDKSINEILEMLPSLKLSKNHYEKRDIKQTQQNRQTKDSTIHLDKQEPKQELTQEPKQEPKEQKEEMPEKPEEPKEEMTEQYITGKFG